MQHEVAALVLKKVKPLLQQANQVRAPAYIIQIFAANRFKMLLVKGRADNEHIDGKVQLRMHLQLRALSALNGTAIAMMKGIAGSGNTFGILADVAQFCLKALIIIFPNLSLMLPFPVIIEPESAIHPHKYYQ